MTDYISREAAINEQKRFRGYLDDDMLYRLEIATKRIPAADVRPVVKAEIIDMRYAEDDGEWKCSHCGWQYTLCVCGKDVTS